LDQLNTYSFTAELKIIGINPYVSIPSDILEKLFSDSKKQKGPIPVCGQINQKPFQQTLLKYKGEWRLYINTQMLPNSPKHVGVILELMISFDTSNRTVEMNAIFKNELMKDVDVYKVFENLTPSLQKEINRYLNSVKKEETLHKNISLAIGFLKGKNRFIGREPL
jgi:hypothetical protein